jgi:hypothetical protein
MSIENENDLNFLLKFMKWGVLTYLAPIILVLVMITGIFLLAILHVVIVWIIHNFVLIFNIIM